MIEASIKFLVVGFVFPIIFGIARFVVNQGDYTHHEVSFILFCCAVLVGMIYYALRANLIVVYWLTSKEWFQLVLVLVLNILFVCVYASIFPVSSGASTAFREQIFNGYSLSRVLAVAVFGPIEEELVMRGFFQKGVFHKSILGLVLTSCLFAFAHGPADMISFIFYMISGIIYGIAYKFSDNFLLPILSHIGYNSFVIFSSFL